MLTQAINWISFYFELSVLNQFNVLLYCLSSLNRLIIRTKLLYINELTNDPTDLLSDFTYRILI